MKIEIKAPAFPESVADGEVSLWHKQEGDFVQRDELLVEIETDKVVMEVVAPEAGRLDRIHVSEGSTIESETLLAEITPGEGEAAAPATEPAETSAEAAGDVPMGPAARQLVEEHGLDPSAISGSGKGGAHQQRRRPCASRRKNDGRCTRTRFCFITRKHSSGRYRVKRCSRSNK
jgi:2-oxoglutarate dehydrogenase E2 component (dihydrolipoamide succinyltransferase)